MSPGDKLDITGQGRRNKRSNITGDSQNGSQPQSQSTRRLNKIGVSMDCLKLKAANSTKAKVDKVVYCVSNVSYDYSVDDIRQYCLDMGVRVLFVFDISRSDGNARTFKLVLLLQTVILSRVVLHGLVTLLFVPGTIGRMRSLLT